MEQLQAERDSAVARKQELERLRQELDAEIQRIDEQISTLPHRPADVVPFDGRLPDVRLRLQR